MECPVIPRKMNVAGLWILPCESLWAPTDSCAAMNTSSLDWSATCHGANPAPTKQRIEHKSTIHVLTIDMCLQTSSLAPCDGDWHTLQLTYLSPCLEFILLTPLMSNTNILPWDHSMSTSTAYLTNFTSNSLPSSLNSNALQPTKLPMAVLGKRSNIRTTELGCESITDTSKQPHQCL